MFEILKQRWKLIVIALFAAVAGVAWMGIQISAISANDPQAIYRLAIQQITVDTLQRAVLFIAAMWVVIAVAKRHVPLGIGRVIIAFFKSGFLFFLGFTLLSLIVLLALSAAGVDEAIMEAKKAGPAGEVTSAIQTFGPMYFTLITLGVGVFWGVVAAWACMGAAWVVVRSQVTVIRNKSGLSKLVKPGFLRTFASRESPFSFSSARIAWSLTALAILVKTLSIYLMQYNVMAVVFSCHLLKMLAPMIMIFALEQFFVALSDRHFSALAGSNSGKVSA